MFSSTPYDSFYENPSSNTCFLMNNFPNSLLNDDEELLFDHLFHNQSPSYDSINNPNSSQNPNNHLQKEEELGHDEFTTSTKACAPPESGGKRKRVAGKQTAGAGGRRRTGKKDRHSKIYTAQGPRDRRMRLSLQIARKFFDLQDMLGFDKASKTIEWLFSKSKPAIRELTSSLPPHQRKSSLVISAATTANKVNDLGDPKINGKPGCSNPVAKASREKARARARERTVEKKKQKIMLEMNPNYSNNNDDNSVTKFDEEELSSKAIENRVSSSVSIIEKLLGNDSSASSSSIYDECSHLGLTGNWVSESLRMYPNYGAISGVDELQVILQQQNPNSVSSQTSSGMQFQSP